MQDTMASRVAWNLQTAHIPYDTMQGKPMEAITAAMSHNTPPQGTQCAHVHFEHSTQAVLDAAAKATYWVMDVGFIRPVPLGRTLAKRYIKEFLHAEDVQVSEWETAIGTNGEDVPGLLLRYHFDGAADSRPDQNINTMLLSSMLFDVPVIVEFKASGGGEGMAASAASTCFNDGVV